MRQFVDAVCWYTREGKIRPLYIRFDEQNTEKVQRMLREQPERQTRQGGEGTRYTIEIRKRLYYLHRTKTNLFWIEPAQ